MSFDRIDAKEAKRRMDEEGWTLLDVRSVQEFQSGHPAGALNLPYLERSGHGMVPNAAFARVVQAIFPDREQKIITTCQMGGRSVRAAQELINLGYTRVVDLRGGFASEKDDRGTVVVPGWRDSGLPVGLGDPADGAYKALLAKADPKPSTPAPAAHDHGHDHGHGHGHGHDHGGAGEAGLSPAAARFAHPSRTVFCVKLQRELPALKRRPMGGPLGDKLRAEVSAEAWSQWVEHSKMIINEYRLNPSDARAQQLLLEQCNAFFYGEGVKLPDEYVPPKPA